MWTCRLIILQDSKEIGKNKIKKGKNVFIEYTIEKGKKITELKMFIHFCMRHRGVESTN